MASSASGDATAMSKEVKAQLKQARDLINQKDHAGALKICEVGSIFNVLSSLNLFFFFKAITKKDKTCYMGWIMISACAQELKQFNQAEYALNKAIELDEKQPLAYQV